MLGCAAFLIQKSRHLELGLYRHRDVHSTWASVVNTVRASDDCSHQHTRSLTFSQAANPWKGFNPIAACFVIGESDKMPDMPTNASALAMDFILKCLNRDKDKRPSAEDLYKHPWLVVED